MESSKLTHIPRDILKLTELKRLDFCGNKIKYVPKFLLGLIELEMLDLRSNEIEEIPLWITKFSKLVWVGLTEEILKNKKQIENIKGISFCFN